MAVGDIWYAKFNFGSNNRAWSFGMHAEEQTQIDPADDGGVLARAAHAQLSGALLNILTTDSVFESVQAWRKVPGTARPGFALTTDSVGTVTGRTMSNDNCLYINLRQIADDAKYNGGIYVSGQSETSHQGSRWNDTFLNVSVKAFTDLIPQNFNAVGGDSGQFRWIILAASFPLPSTPKGEPFDIVEAAASDRVMSQRRRQQKVQGYANSI